MTRTPWAGLYIADIVRHLAETEIAAAPEDVGPPVAIVQVTQAHFSTAS
jgi:hypothetical protein